jgi:hypothetical protein
MLPTDQTNQPVAFQGWLHFAFEQMTVHYIKGFKLAQLNTLKGVLVLAINKGIVVFIKHDLSNEIDFHDFMFCSWLQKKVWVTAVKVCK